MQVPKEALLNQLQEYKRILKKIERKTGKELEGNLRVSTGGGKVRLYFCKDKKQIYIGKKQLTLAVSLAQRDYSYEVKKLLEVRVKQFEKLLTDYKEDELSAIYENLNAARKKLVTPIVQSDEKYAEQWESIYTIKKEFRSGDPEIWTERGERVRSKSEKILADKFLMKGIPYRYEAMLDLKPAGPIYPDFTVLNRRTRKEFYWEHFGMMDDMEYSEKAINRIELYEKNGIFPGIGLILTFETKRNPLNMQIVDNIMKEYLLS